MSWTLTPVDDVESANAWFALPGALYRDDPDWRSREAEERAVFDPGRNPCYADGVVYRWLLHGAGGEPAGRVAAFGRNPGPEVVGGIGFFECVDDAAAAATLLDAAEAFLGERGFAGADAPINFGERDRFWGLRVHGQGPALYLEPYAAPHQRAQLEASGYAPRMESHTYRAPLAPVPFAWLESWAQKVEARGIRFELIADDVPRLAATFCALYSSAFPASGRVKTLAQSDVEAMLRAAPDALRPRIWAALDGEAPVGVLVHAPDPLTPSVSVSNVLAVAEGYRRQGLGAGMSHRWLHGAYEAGFEEFALAGIGRHTENMVAFAVAGVGMGPAYVHWTFRRWFDGRPVEPLALGEW